MSTDTVTPTLAIVTSIPDTTRADSIQERQLALQSALINAEDVTMEDTLWVWNDLIQADRLSLIVGDGGMGKGMLTAWLFARLSTGDLPGIHQGKPVKSLFISTEEHYSSETAPRLKAQEADFKQVTFMDEEKFHLILDDIGRITLAKFMSEEGFVIAHLDPIIDFFPDGKNSNKEEDVRSVLRPLNQAAMEYGTSIVGLRHVAKSSTSLNNLIMGSSAWRNSARTAVGLLQHPEDDSLRVALNLKINNGSEASNGLCFRIVNTKVDGLDRGVGRIEWTDDSYSRSDLEQMTGQNAKEREKMSDKKSDQDTKVKEYFQTHDGKVEPSQGQKDLMSILNCGQSTLYNILKRNNVVRGNKGGVWSLDMAGREPPKPDLPDFAGSL